jgi:hypothetical protein
LNGTGTIDFSLLAEEEKEKKKSKSTLHVIWKSKEGRQHETLTSARSLVTLDDQYTRS